MDYLPIVLIVLIFITYFLLLKGVLKGFFVIDTFYKESVSYSINNKFLYIHKGFTMLVFHPPRNRVNNRKIKD